MENVISQDYTLLVVDDEPNVRSAVRRLFFDKYDVVEASDAPGALDIIRKRPEIAVLLVDYGLEGSTTGLEILKDSVGILPHSKRVLFTGKADLNMALAAVNEGHIDYLIRKPWNNEEMKAVVDRLIELVALERHNRQLVEELRRRNQELENTAKELAQHKKLLEMNLNEREKELLEALQRLQEMNDKLRAMAVRDSLTGLYNHGILIQRLEEETARAIRQKSPISLIFCDIDHFKIYNDNLGHAIGDEVLRKVAQFLLNGDGQVPPARKSDVVGRYGGEEFVIILPDTSKEGALIRAERLREGANRLDIPGAEFQPLGHFSMSFGVSTFPWDAHDSTELLEAGDNALYEAKRGGRDRVVSAPKKYDSFPSWRKSLKQSTTVRILLGKEPVFSKGGKPTEN